MRTGRVPNQQLRKCLVDILAGGAGQQTQQCGRQDPGPYRHQAGARGVFLDYLCSQVHGSTCARVLLTSRS